MILQTASAQNELRKIGIIGFVRSAVEGRWLGALELGKTADHLHHHAVRWRDGIDTLGQRSEPSIGGFDPVEQVGQILQGSR